MTKRLLITAGCSFTEDSYYHQFGIMSWPRIMSDSLGIELVNLGRGGNSNDSIENQVTDAVIKYADRDPIVMVLWTEPIRINVFDGKTMFLIGDMAEEKEYPGSDLWPKVDPIDFSYYVMKHSLRTMWRTKTIVENLGLRYVDYLGDFHIPNLTKGSLANAYKNIRSDWYFNNLNFTMREIESGGIDYTRIPIDGHPDQSGHEKIANIMIDRYMNQLKKKVEFTYD